MTIDYYIVIFTDHTSFDTTGVTQETLKFDTKQEAEQYMDRLNNRYSLTRDESKKSPWLTATLSKVSDEYTLYSEDF